MIVAYRELPPEAGGWPCPLLDVSVADLDDIRVRCLVDSGALNTLLPSWVAEAAGIEIGDAPERALAVGGTPTTAVVVPTVLTVADHSWEAEVGFCDPWPYGWGLLGQLSFFRYFTVTLRAADFEFEIEPISS